MFRETCLRALGRARALFSGGSHKPRERISSRESEDRNSKTSVRLMLAFFEFINKNAAALMN
jgi:hypothetical protein